MYQDAGYGENWQPAANNARRIDPYSRSCAVLGALFAVGFVLIIIIVLSLIPLYISHNSAATTTNTNSQVLKVTITNYMLQFAPPFNNFDPQTILSQTNNRQTLLAALTSLLQTDSTTIGSVAQINTLTTSSNRKRRQTSNSTSITFGLNVISNKSCSSQTCVNQYQYFAIQVLSDQTKTLVVRYQASNSSQIYWLYCQLPRIIQSNVTLVFADVQSVSSMFNSLMDIDATENQPSVENSTSFITG